MDGDVELGPTGEYPFGKPLIGGDKGGLDAQFVVNEEEGLAAFNFGKAIGGFGLTKREARDMAARIRHRVLEILGAPDDCDYQDGCLKGEEFPIRYELMDTEVGPRIMLWMPRKTVVIVGSSLFWLIFCDILDAEAAKVMEH